MNNYMPKNFDEILINPKDKLSILKFFINLIKFNNDPILSKELEKYCRNWQEEDVLNLKNICIILGTPGSGKTTLIKYLCDKLNMRECYYESESQEHINYIRNINEEEENSHYYHPYNNFILYSNCQIGSTEKPKILLEKKKELERKKIDNFVLTETSNQIKRRHDEKDIFYSNKILKISSENNNRNKKINDSFLINNLKKKIIEDSIETNNINNRIANGFFKIHDLFINILQNLIEANLLKEKENYGIFASNNFNKIINKNSIVANKIMKKISNILVLSQKLKEQIIEYSTEVDKIKKKRIIDLFADNNYSEHIINDLNELNNLNEEINTDFNESNHLNKKIIDNLNLYNNLKEEINEDLILANTLKEELNYLIETKNLKKKIEDLLISNDYLKKQKKNNFRLKEIYNYIIMNNSDEKDNNDHISNKLNREIKYFIESNKSKEIIKELIITKNLKQKASECIAIDCKLNERMNDMKYRESKENNERLHNIILSNSINKKIRNSIINENYKGKLIDLIVANNFNEYIINDFNISNTVKELIIDNIFLSNYLKDIFIINFIVINYLKEEMINDFIVASNSNGRIDENLNIDNIPIIKKKNSIKNNNSIKNFKDNFNVTNNLYKEINFFVENDNLDSKTNDSFYNENSYDHINDSIKVNNTKEESDDELNVPDKLFKKLKNFLYEIYKLNKKIINNLNKSNNVFENIISYLNENNSLKMNLLNNFIEVINLRDKVIDSLTGNNSIEKMDCLVTDNSLYKNIMNIDFKKKREEEKKKLYYEKNYIVTRAIIIDELPVTELEYSEEFRDSCVSSMQFVFNRVDFCKQEHLKYSKEKNFSKYLECYTIHPIIIFINSYEQIKTVNTLLGVDINYSPYVHFIKLKKIHPLYLEKILTERYYCKMINSNKETKEIIKHYAHNCNGDIRSCFNALDFLNRIPDLHKMSFEEINNVSTICQNDIFGFVKKVLYRNICTEIISERDIQSSNCLKYDFHLSSPFKNKNEDKYTEDITNKNIHTSISLMDNEEIYKINNTMDNVLEMKNKTKNSNPLIINKKELKNDNNVSDSINKKNSVYMNIFEELDNKADIMNISEKFQILSLLKENYLFFYNSLSDIARLISNLSIIDFSFHGADCSNLLMRKSYDNLNGDIIRFINDHFRLTYRYYFSCNRNPRVPIGNPSFPPNSEEKYTLDVIKKKKLQYSIQNPDSFKIPFTFKTNPMNKYYHHFSIVRKELYDRYIMIAIKKLINQNKNNIDIIASKYSFFLRGNHELFSSFFPCYILLIIEYWNSQFKKEHNDINEDKNISSLNKSDLNMNPMLYFNKFHEITCHFKLNVDENRKISEHANDIISFTETFITPKFIALFFPSYLKYLNNETKQKKNVKNLIGKQAVSIETYFEMRNLLRLHDMELYNYFFSY
ncbi:conserved Plasmodium protein, unknown function [Plasmodium gallinaceum]|uniref:Uncharacterized protein n=1 Tax=Plasmodium gallinaceum TaxID=5849 RepID=A0A1J1GUK4_PLAGA|nr:conserved Plasmodium protein, unknown function [Plasmodium gallinaceum]CRG95923.1 conserved Plasmodium protein, unknown function [Plasmodium gallinaceum]